MKVLHLPYNVASQVSVSVKSLRGVGVTARGVVDATPAELAQSHDELELLPDTRLPPSFRWIKHQVGRHAMLMSAIAWADILHWHFGQLVLRGGFDLKWARFLHKPGVAEFWGTDVRVAEIEAADNPHFAVHAPLDYRTQQTSQRSFETQSRFAAAGFSCIVADGAMLSYVRRDLFPKVYLVRQRLSLPEYVPRPPEPNRKRPLIVHSPSNPQLKGSEYVQEAVNNLRGRYDFEFRLVHGVPRDKALAILADADIFIDQLILGTHGLATLEAMALAKPVVCYIKPSMVAQYPPDLPVANANPDNVTEVLEALLADGGRRRNLGIQGRAYVEKHHDACKLALQLRDIYQEILARG